MTWLPLVYTICLTSSESRWRLRLCSSQSSLSAWMSCLYLKSSYCHSALYTPITAIHFHTVYKYPQQWALWLERINETTISSQVLQTSTKGAIVTKDLYIFCFPLTALLDTLPGSIAPVASPVLQKGIFLLSKAVSDYAQHQSFRRLFPSFVFLTCKWSFLSFFHLSSTFQLMCFSSPAITLSLISS